MSYNQVVISSGHSVNAQGMSDVINEVNEAIKVADRVHDIVKSSGKSCYKYHDIAHSSSQNLANIVNFHNQYKDGIDVSIHFNAHMHTDKPMGVEVCYYNQSTLALASEMSLAISKASGLKNRGAKQRTELYFLRKTNKPAILIEVCFGDSTKDCQLYKAHFESICQAIVKTLIGDIINNHKPNDYAPEIKNDNISTNVSVEIKSDVQKAKEYVNGRCKELQSKLITLGYNCGGYGADSQFGQGTYNSLIQFQKDNPPLAVDGLAGVATFAKLNELIAKKNSCQGNDWIRRLQKELNIQGFRDKNGNKLSEDGILGEMTISAMPVIKKGTRGNITKLVQELLVSKGYDTGGVDGIASSKTESAIRSYQGARNISIDGCFGKDSLRVYRK